MQGFSPKSVQAINDFVGNLGMSPVGPAEDGSYNFAFERAGILGFAPSADGKRAIMSLKAARADRPTADDMARFLSLAQRDPMTQLPITAGMVGGAFVLAANIPSNAFDLQKIEHCLDRLIQLQSGAP
ncbi:CesT family type III secretion system chaperone [Yoonia sp. BS5-3]|uniref:CesT family type III secretion system chaperone n=1 Tax=Yoonia phaeophyticola TaxID=3137369 RepID=A0ABZ2V3X1_9RHOB